MKQTVVLFFLLSIISGHSQTFIRIYNEDIAVPFAKITYQTQNKPSKRVVMTNINGEANIPTDNNSTHLFISISQTGYHLIEDTIKVNSKKDYRLISNNTLIGEICVTGEYAPINTNQAINKITIIRKEDILNSGSSTLNDILTYQSNIRIDQDNILGSGISMSGMSGQNVKILQDGVPVIGRLDGNIDLSQINLDNIERIEIVNGPLSVNYGTNALAGTINIITKKTGHKGFTGNVLTQYESVGNYNLSGNINYRHKHHNVKVNGGRKYFDGWSSKSPFFSFPKETIADTNRYLSWNPKLQYFGEISYSLKMKKWNFNPYIRYYQEKITNRGRPKKPYFETAFDDYYYTLRFDQGINIDGALKNGKFNIVSAYNYFKREKNTYFKDLTTLQQNLTPGASTQDTTLFDSFITRATYSSTFKNWFSYQAGADINIETATGKKIKNNKQIIGDYALFGSAIISVLNKKLDIKPGLRYAYNTVFKSPLTPSLNIKYDLKEIQFRASIAQGFRSPTLKELYLNFVDINHNIVGNTNLIPETSLNFITGITWIKPIQTKNVFKIDGSFFYNDFENRIHLQLLDNGKYAYINIGIYNTLGGQAEASYQSKKLRVRSSLSYIGRYNPAEHEDLDIYIYSPEVSTTISYKILKEKITLNAFYKFNGKIIYYRLIDDIIETNTTSGYHIFDLSLGTKVLNNRLNITLGAKNLFNVKNINTMGIINSGSAHSTEGSVSVGRGTSVFLSLNYKFKHYPSSK